MVLADSFKIIPTGKSIDNANMSIIVMFVIHTKNLNMQMIGTIHPRSIMIETIVSHGISANRGYFDCSIRNFFTDGIHSIPGLKMSSSENQNVGLLNKVVMF
jgi:hypothetical protein